MKELNAILQKVVVQQFYRRNAGFFLVVIFLGFGIQQPASFFISPYFLIPVAASPLFTALVLAFCLLYYFKCLHFFWKVLQATENEFIYVASLLPDKEINLSLGIAYLSIFSPVLLYTIWLGVVGAINGTFLAIAFVLAYHLLLLWTTVWLLKRRLQQHISIHSAQGFGLAFSGLSVPAFLWPLRHLLHQEKTSLLFTKLFSFALLAGFMLLYPYPEYDMRPTQIGFLMAVTSHVMLLQQIHAFQERGLLMQRNLPIPVWQRFAHMTLLFLVLLFPEGFLIFRLTSQWSAAGELMQLYGFGTSFLLLLYVWLYKPGFQQENHLRQVFFLFMGLLLLFLYHPPLWPLVILFALFAFSLYNRWYWQYETVDT